MTDLLPIACSLSDEERATRTGWISELNRGFLRHHQLEHGTLRLEYDVAAAENVLTLVEREQECCAFLHFAILASDDRIELRIDAPVSDGMNVEPLFAPFLGGVS
ncbi:MAG: hypothetical protein ABI889_12885 [Gemmatimonadota bacterium]